jgi:6-phosphofructokinase
MYTMGELLRLRSPGERTPLLQSMRKRNLCVGILHSGGPAPGGNRVIAGAAKQFLDRGICSLGFYNGYEWLEQIAPNKFKEGLHFLNLTDPIVSSAIDVNALIIRTSRANPGKSIKTIADFSDPEKIRKINNVLDVFEWLRIGALVSIGGDDTLKTANFIQKVASRRNGNFMGVIHVPKTIDNDYKGIPWTFGFFTAAEAAGRIVRGFYDDAKATNCVHIVELMGRKAGWYTAAAAMFGRATYTIIPEDFIGKDFDLSKLVNDIVDIMIEREKQGKGYGVICVAEGIANLLSDAEKQKLPEDRHGNINLSGAKIGEALSNMAEAAYVARTGKSKSFKAQRVGYETRQGPPNLYDALLTSQLGVGAFALIQEGRFGEMVTVRDNLEIDGIPFDDLIDQITLKVVNRNVDPNGDFYRLLRSLETHFPR